MQSIEGGVSQGVTDGGSGNIGVAPEGGRKVQYGVNTADNLNPQAPDCYYYYYSNCTKGSQCKFRHCSASLGTEEICELWLNDGHCQRQVCGFRHSVPERQRSAIPCFWETQVIGCLKTHCPFLHVKPRPKTPGIYDRLDQFKKADEEMKFASLKVKSLDEIRQEKQPTSSNTLLPQAHSTTLTHSTTHTRPYHHTTSYNRVYTPSRPSNSPPITTSTSQTSFKLTSVLQSTGLTTNSTARNTVQAGRRADVSTANSQVHGPQPINVGGVSKPVAQSQGKAKISPFIAQPAQGDSSLPIKDVLPRSKVGVATMDVQGSSTSIFGAQCNPSSVFSPNYQPGAKPAEMRNKEVEQDLRGLITGMRKDATLQVRGKGHTVSVNDKGEREEREGKTTRIVKLENATTVGAATEVPPAKKIKVASLPTSKISAPTKSTSPSQPQPKATLSPIRAPQMQDKGHTAIGTKVGVASVGGRGQTGSGDFHVKSLEEIRAEKRRRQEDGERLTQPLEKKESTISTRTKLPVTMEKKVVRIKKRGSSLQEQVVEKGEMDGDWETGERGGSDEGRKEEDGHVNLSEQMAKTDDGSNDVMGKPLAPAGKRRKLSRTPLSATPTTNSLVIAASTATVVQPQATTDNHAQPKPAKHNEIETTAISAAPSPPTVTTKQDEEGCSDEREPSAPEHSSIERVPEESVGSAERKMSLSEMKAQIQSELRDRSDSEILSYDQLDSELAQLEEELEGEGEGEGGDVEDVLLDSRTDDDLMLDFAEFL